jgi:fibro-slime domain-containing protein
MCAREGIMFRMLCAVRAAGVCLVALAIGLATASPAAGAIAFTFQPTVRDFHQTQTDFEILDFNAQTPTAYFANDQTNKIEKGIVGPIGASLGGNGLPVYSPLREAGFYNTVSSAASLAQWFADIAGTNVQVPGVTLPFTDNGNGTYSYNNTAFFPIDNQGFGNEGNAHNQHFTAQIHRPFTYQAGTGQTLSIISDDDAWVFVNHRLAIDAGGIHGTLGGSVHLDTLALAAGGVYDLDIFFADRNRFGSAMILTTNFIPTVAVPEPSSVLLLLVAVGGFALGGIRRRRAPSC